MAERLAEDLWRLDIPLIGNPLKNLNSYLITGDRNLLIDTGFRQAACMEAMERQLDEIGVDRDRMDIFLTHLHSDHSGLAPDLIRPGCRIYIGREDGARMAEYQDDEFWRVMYEEHVQDGFSVEEMRDLWTTNPAKCDGPAPYEDYIYLDDGDFLRYGNHDLQCILTPGHTPGHMCLYEPDVGWMFSGDHVLFHISPNICRWGGVADSLGDFLLSLDQISKLRISLILPAHRQETGNTRARAHELRVHHFHRIEDAWKTVRNEPGLTAYEIAGRMVWSIRCRNWADFPLPQKFFAVGEAMAHLDYLEKRGRIVRRLEENRYRYYAVIPDKK